MRTELGPLYVAHADRLYSYCWSLVGEQLAPTAVGSTFSVAVNQRMRIDNVLWLYSLSRAVCAELGAFTDTWLGFEDDDPLLRAASELHAHHREVLLLKAGEWLDVHDIARLLGLAPDTVAHLVIHARMLLEQAILDILIRDPAQSQLDVISAFEDNRLPNLLARRAPARAPGWLRDQVTAICEQESGWTPPPNIIEPAPGAVERPKRELCVGVRAGVAASAALIGLTAFVPVANKGVDSLVPAAIKEHITPGPEHEMGAMPKAPHRAEKDDPPPPRQEKPPVPPGQSDSPPDHSKPPPRKHGPGHRFKPPGHRAPHIPPVVVPKTPAPPSRLPKNRLPRLPESRTPKPGLLDPTIPWRFPNSPNYFGMYDYPSLTRTTDTDGLYGQGVRGWWP
ncbi:RNA polymerase sigma factor [Actinomadura chibensis]|uniref:Uncharacterized protein n=1 Tax=Actinomadura chibensis TaxID=392828 RepID=A0A5D0NNJ2_9ACTN|nr:hypothetical protein [Actinomadura chibensis]TYB45591.1 hypothetical protein FXF69_19380 [Actinomadura chibensis]